MGPFLQYTVTGLTVGSFYALVALGYTIVYGIIRLINFAQGDLSMVGAFLGWTLGCLFVYSALFGTGSYLYGRTPQALMFTVLFGASAIGLVRLLPMVWGSRQEET